MNIAIEAGKGKGQKQTHTQCPYAGLIGGSVCVCPWCDVTVCVCMCVLGGAVEILKEWNVTGKKKVREQASLSNDI